MAPLLPDPLPSSMIDLGSVAAKAFAAAGTGPAFAARERGFCFSLAGFGAGSLSRARARAVGGVRPVQTRIGSKRARGPSCGRAPGVLPTGAKARAFGGS